MTHMNQWAFVVAAYAITLLGTAVVSVLSWRAMRAAEAETESVSGRP
ncbi:MAG: hypothetical protein PSY12_02395 [bacterium]|nr:hypothetical protein [bacterium]